MGKNGDYADLVSQARLGDRRSMDRLAEMVRERLYDHVYRITLRSHLAQDIVQESLLEMFRMLDNLQSQDEFWPWLCAIAHNKLLHHERWQRRHATVPLPDLGYDLYAEDRQEALAELISEELKKTVLTAMSNLKPQHRAVLTMRCYDELEYSQVARLMGCSKFAAKMLFCRAKKALGKQLARRGLGKGAPVLALTLFGKMTASSKSAAAQVAVTTASTQTGGAAGLAVMASSKGGITMLAAAGMVAAGAMVLTVGNERADALLAGNGTGTVQAPLSTTALAECTEECWYYFPDGISGGVMSRSIRYDARGQQPWCQWLQNDTANYYFDRKADTIYLENHRMWNRDLSVCSLPTDPPQLTEFLAQVQGLDLSTEYVPAKGRALLVVAQRGRLEDSGGWRIVRHHNVLEEDYFRCDWPSGTRIVDRRDALHQRGWTCFRMEGTVNGKEISGVGRMPFVYAAAKWYPPWLRVYTADSSSILDLPSGAALCDIDGRVQAVYPAGSFFKGLARPWMGLHAIDTIRRDAAEQQLLFDITLQPKTDTSEVVVFTETGKLVYLVDMKRDLVDQISIDTGETEGELRFSYTEDNIAQSEHTGFARERGKHGGPAEQSDGILWLVHLAKEDLVK